MKKGDTATIAVSPVSYQWLLEKEMISSLKTQGIAARFSSVDTSDLLFSLHPISVSIQYSEPFRHSFLSERVTERNISLNFSALISKKTTGEIYYSGDEYWSSTDTVAYDVIAQLENPEHPVSHGKFLQQNWYENYFEPFVVIGTTAIVIFLFFTVRS